ncbi:GDP-L-fucose synthase family protein [Saccharicrinis sp. FJH2]|uniref:GDP-L-fucose synthase family protein n=1 Tax=Saccharicrinis sp. FJH65 TaxID=3344659 RepID=UPI0035F3A151
MNLNSKIYIAGHLGLVGSAITKKLRERGFSHLILRSREELDLMDQDAVSNFFQHEKPEYVILAAAKVGGIIANTTYRAQFIYENIQIQNNVIHQSYLNKVKKLLFLGSTCIYPQNAPQPMSEECLLTDTLEYTNEPYAIAKIAGLKMCEAYNLQYGTNFISVMPTNLYGPNDNFNLETSHVLPAMIRKIHLAKCFENNDWDLIKDDLDKRPIEGINGSAPEDNIRNILLKYGIAIDDLKTVKLSLWGTGKPLREFLWSEDMAEACIFLLENYDFKDVINSFDHSKTNKIRNTHINIGTGKEISIMELAFSIKKNIGFKGEIVWDSSKPDGTMRKLTDPSKLHKLGWKHKTELAEGIQLLYRHYLNN